MRHAAVAVVAGLVIVSRQLAGQIPQPIDPLTATPLPRVELRSATVLRLPGEVDSNSPAVWERVNGQPRLFVMTSVAGRPSTTSGATLATLAAARPVVIDPWPGGGIWMEAVVADVDGTWYGYYHNENIAPACASSGKMIPSIGAARSRDFGATWEPLGTVLAAPTLSYDCVTNDKYFVGGLGDFSVQLDADSRYLYFFLSQYVRTEPLQGVAIARLLWADRDRPARRATVWQDGRWMVAATRFGMERWIASAFPIFPAREPFHDDDTLVDAFWGPSVHWNTYLQQYVMLLNRSKDTDWNQEGVYVSYAKQLDDPRLWSAPTKILNGGWWYPQVIGLEDGVGTDKVAGELSRLFMRGTSAHFIRFIK
jgi:hypothetical protein